MEKFRVGISTFKPELFGPLLPVVLLRASSNSNSFRASNIYRAVVSPVWDLTPDTVVASLHLFVKTSFPGSYPRSEDPLHKKKSDSGYLPLYDVPRFWLSHTCILLPFSKHSQSGILDCRGR